MAGIFNDTQRKLIRDAHDKLQRQGSDLKEYSSLIFREEFIPSQQPLSRSSYPTAHQGSSQGPRSRKNSQQRGAHYPNQLFHSTLQHTPSPFAASQGPSGMGDTAIKTEPYQQLMFDTIPYTSPAGASMSREASAANEEGPSNSEEMAFPAFSLGSDPRPEGIQVARSLNTLSTGANIFHLRRQVSNAPHGGSMSTPTNTFPADSRHPNNLASANFAFVPENQPFFVNPPYNAGVSTIYNSSGLSQISPTAPYSQSYLPPVSLPQASISVPSPQFAPMISEHQQMPTSLPYIVANFTQGTVVTNDANQMISMLAVPNNQQTINHSQFPSNLSSGASSQTGVIRTARATRRQRSTPIGHPGPTWPRFLKNGFVVCQWENCKGPSFYTPKTFEEHCKKAHHVSGSNNPAVLCKWRGCHQTTRSSLVRHILNDHGGVLYLCPGRCGRKPTTRPDPQHVCPTA